MKESLFFVCNIYINLVMFMNGHKMILA